MFTESRPDSPVGQRQMDALLRALLTAIPTMSVCPESMIKEWPTEIWNSMRDKRLIAIGFQYFGYSAE